MSLYDELRQARDELMREFEAPVVIVERRQKGAITKEQRARGEDGHSVITFECHGLKRTQTKRAMDGVIYTITTMLLDNAVENNDKIIMGDRSYTVTAVSIIDPTGSDPVSWRATLE